MAVKSVSWDFISCMGLKKAARSRTPSESVMWPPIQRPEIDTRRTLILKQATPSLFDLWEEWLAPALSGTISWRLNADHREPLESWSVLHISWVTYINAMQHVGIGDQLAKCSACSAVVGSKEDDRELIRLFKWDICLQRGRTMAWESYEVQNFLCARLRALIASQGTRKFVAYSGELGASQVALLVSHEGTQPRLLKRS